MVQELILDQPNADWIFIRQALSLALLKNRQVVFPQWPIFIEGRPDYHPVIEDMTNALADMGAGRLLADGNALRFIPRPLVPRRFSLRSGPFSSATELLLLLMPALFHADFRSVIEVDGVTHSPLSCPTAWIKASLMGLLERLGFFGSLTLRRFGFHGSGGGFMESRIYPLEAREWTDLSVPSTASIGGVQIFIARLSTELAEMEKDMLAGLLDIEPGKISIIEVMECDGPGNSIQLHADRGGIPLVLFKEMKLYGNDGVLSFSEDDMRNGIKILVEEGRSVLRNNTLPVGLARELHPYLILSGMEGKPSVEAGSIGLTVELCEAML